MSAKGSDKEYVEIHSFGPIQGWTMRDEFAAKAMPIAAQYKGNFPDEIAAGAYRIADAMIKAREGE